MPDAPLQILSITRFAYPGPGAFQQEHESVEARQAALWAPERLERRFRSLEHVTLRTLAAQTDGAFAKLVVTGDALPRAHADRLRDLVATVPGAEVVFHPPENQRHAMERLVNARLDPEGPPSLQFRMDDDDGVGLRFVERARRAFEDVAPLFRRHGRLAIDFNRGFALRLGPRVEVEPQVRAHLGVAQAVVLRASVRRTALHFPHHRIATMMPSVTLTDAPMWLRGVDGTNDSPVEARGLRPADAEQRAELDTRFGLDLAAIEASF
ncbi:putative rhamnosyl transferase [Jannaschia sp. W003]|uniref:putative rhamnosyl transferase n=1 Tax=Jannaschia sp. W003 TaxID=2867012 RepID=UPI0021A67A55|nr:putative rhamnosyl transferase [Jannaschia sp. W003]UWQ20880.1 putative rhamnosyl transferase [Jannaschia sp. W003]